MASQQEHHFTALRDLEKFFRVLKSYNDTDKCPTSAQARHLGELIGQAQRESWWSQNHQQSLGSDLGQKIENAYNRLSDMLDTCERHR